MHFPSYTGSLAKSETFQKAVCTFADVTERMETWLSIRKESIKFIKETSHKLDDSEKKRNKGKYDGACMGLGGVAVLGAGAVASIFTMGAAALFFGTGIVATAGSAFLSAGADLVWFKENESYVNKVKEALSKDNIKQKEVLLKVQDLKDLIKQVSEEENITEEEALKNVVITFLSALNLDVLSYHQKVIKGITFLFSKAEVFITLSAVVSIAKASVVVGSSLATAAVSGAAIATLPILAAINIYQLYDSSEKIKTGSKSNASEKLQKAAKDLEEESKGYKDCLLHIYCRKFRMDLANLLNESIYAELQSSS